MHFAAKEKHQKFFPKKIYYIFLFEKKIVIFWDRRSPSIKHVIPPYNH